MYGQITAKLLLNNLNQNKDQILVKRDNQNCQFKDDNQTVLNNCTGNYRSRNKFNIKTNHCLYLIIQGLCYNKPVKILLNTGANVGLVATRL